MTIETEQDDEQETLDDGTDLEPLVLAEVAENKFTEDWGLKSGRPASKFSASAVGKCRRQMYNQKFGLTVFDRYVQGVMQVGKRHHLWLEYNLPALVDRQLRTEVRAQKTYVVEGEELYVSGIADAVDDVCVYDHKFTGSTRYVRDSPRYTHLAQIAFYMGALDTRYGQIEYYQRNGKLESNAYLYHRIDRTKAEHVRSECLHRMHEVVLAVKDALEAGTDEARFTNPFDKCTRDDGGPCFSCRKETFRDEVRPYNE